MEAAGLTIRDFLAQVEALLPARLPPELRPYQRRQVWSLFQVHYGNPAIHYEVWPQRKTGRLEIGLHFEGVREESYAWAARLAERALEVRSALGPGVELEEWTSSWARLHETWAMNSLTGELAERVAGRLATYIAALQPLLVGADIPVEQAPSPGPEDARPRGSSRHWRRRRRARLPGA